MINGKNFNKCFDKKQGFDKKLANFYKFTGLARAEIRVLGVAREGERLCILNICENFREDLKNDA